MDDNDLSKPFKIHFVGEPAVDHGGPSREFFSLINQHMHGSMLCGSTFRHNVVSLPKYEFMKKVCFRDLLVQNVLERQ